MPVWTRGALLDPAVFHDTFFGRYDSLAASRLLQSAAREAATAHPRTGLKRPAEDLADAVQAVGIHRWPPFLARSAERADEVLASDDPRVIRVGATDVPAGLALALGFAVLGAIMAQGGRSAQDRGGSAPPVPPTTLRQDAPESAQDPAKGEDGADPDEGAQQMPPLPANPDDLLAQGWKETTHPGSAATGRRTFIHPETGQIIEFDTGKPGEDGFSGKDHYHVPNPHATGKRDRYLDRNGRPVPRGSKASHLRPNYRYGDER